MKSLRLPRSLVTILCALIVGGPAAYVLAASYRVDSLGRVIHHHTSVYTTWIQDMSNLNEPALETRINEARSEWDVESSETRVPRVGSSHDNSHHIHFDRKNLGDSNSVVEWESTQHDTHSNVTFNSAKTGSFTGDEKRGRACRVIGYILGLAGVPNTTRNDCMENPDAYRSVGTTSLNLADDIYRHTLSTPSGSLWDNRNETLNPDRSYKLQATGTGHGMRSVKIFLDGDLDNPVASDAQPECVYRCSRTAIWEPAAGTLSPGEHTVRIESKTFESSKDKVQEFKIFVAHDTGILRHYTFEEQELRDRSTARVNVANGNLVLEERDVQLPGTGVDLVVGRHFNGLGGRETGFGRGWSMSTGEGVELQQLSGGDVRFLGPTGYSVRFKNVAGSAYSAPKGLDAELTDVSGGGWTLKFLSSEERFKFDASGRLTEHLDRDDHKLQFAYDGSSRRLTTITDTQGRHIDFDYYTAAEDPLRAGLIEKMTERTADFSAPRTWAYTYDGNRHLTQYLDPSQPGQPQQKPVKYTYTGDRLTGIEDPLGHDTQITYDGRDRVTGLVRDAPPDGSGFTTAFSYNTGYSECESGQESTKVEDPIGSASAGDPNDHETTYCTDGESRVKKVFDAFGHKQEIGYSGLSNVNSYQSPTGQQYSLSYGSNASGFERLTSLTAPGNVRTTLSYNSGNQSFRPDAITDPQGHQLSYTYGGTGRLSTVKDPAGKTFVEINYREQSETSNPLKVGSLEFSKDGEANKTDYDVDEKGRLIRESPPKGTNGTVFQGDTVYGYDARSRLETVTDGEGRKRKITYDVLDRPDIVDYGTFDASLNTPRIDDRIDHDWDLNGNLTKLVDGRKNKGRDDQTDEYTYDARNLRIRDKLRSGREVFYTYDHAANLDTLQYKAGEQSLGITDYDYNELNLASKIDESAVAGNFTYDYDNDQRLKTLTLPNGVAQRYTYENDTTEPNNMTKSGRVESIKATAPGGATLTHLTYDYTGTTGSETGLVQQVDDLVANRKTEYRYDFLNRLETATVKNRSTNATIDSYAYGWTDASNRTHETKNGNRTDYTTNAASELTQVGSNTLSYDEVGNATETQSDLKATYNHRNQATAMDPVGAAPLFELDYAGETQTERVQKGQTTYTKNILGLGAQDEPGAPSPTWFTRNPDTGQALSMLRPAAGVDRYFLTDHLGTVIATTDEAGNLGHRYSYEPFGEQSAPPTGSGPDSPIRFANQYLDSETGLYKMGLRYYDPEVGRWTQKDPLNLFQDPRQANRYVYAGADPVNLADPAGAHVCDVVNDIESFADPFGTSGGLIDLCGGDEIDCATVAAGYRSTGYLAWGAAGLPTPVLTPPTRLALGGIGLASGGVAFVFDEAAAAGVC